MKKYISNILLFLIFFAGLSLLVYPSFSDWWNQSRVTTVIANYDAVIDKVDTAWLDEAKEAAIRYNQELAKNGITFKELDEEEKERYESLLNVADTGVIGYIEIPIIKCNLPIYHGTDETVLQVAAGHLEWSSLPIGGESTHAVLSGHRGLPSARLFTDIDQLREGDTFLLNILGEVLTYEVDQILTVLPSDVSSLQISKDQDYCTLVTCTPYGINSHRLLVRGHRIETEKEAKVVRVTADALLIDSKLVAIVVAIPILFVLLIVVFVTTGKKKK